jgi:histidinol dehydrogenase
MIKILKTSDFLKHLENREILNFGLEDKVKEIIEGVRKNGDEYIIELSKKFDNITDNNFSLEVTQSEITQAFDKIDKKLIDTFIEAKNNIFEYHSNQKMLSWNYTRGSTTLGQFVNPIEKVGLYVPGGLGYYPSSVLMNAIPALVAGVPEIYLATPPRPDGTIDPSVLVCARLCNVKKVFKTGGAQAVAAFAYGTKTIPKVYKVTGPGNMYVTLAKKILYGIIDIDSIAGPSEVMILADNTSNLEYIVHDFFAQSEHSSDAQSVLLVPDEALAAKFIELLKKKLKDAKRKDILEKSIKNNGIIVIYENLSDAFRAINEYAPEHLQIMPDIGYDVVAKNVKNAGAVFLGEYTPVPMGDYFAGTNHTLPTGGTAKFSSPLGVHDYIKFSSVVKYSREDFLKAKNKIVSFAKHENFFEHAMAVEVRE